MRTGLFVSVLFGMSLCACPPELSPGGNGSSASGTIAELPATTEPEPPPTTGATTGTTGADTTADPASTGSSAASTTGGPYCGDEQVDPTEECDDGPNNADDGACTLQCKSAVCGDGHVQAGVEACDDGPNNSAEYGGCDACQWAPRCGDGDLDLPWEECDAGEKNGSGQTDENTGGCTAGCRWQGRVAFITSTKHTGALGGLDGADIICRERAYAAGLDGAVKFRAWLSDPTGSPAQRFQQIELTNAPYLLLRTGRIVAKTFGELVNLGPSTGISVTETGELVFEEFAWTNTTGLGNLLDPADHCDYWTSASQQLTSHSGLNALPLEEGPDWNTWRSERQWTVAGVDKCYRPYRLYCFEDGYEPDE